MDLTRIRVPNLKEIQMKLAKDLNNEKSENRFKAWKAKLPEAGASLFLRMRRWRLQKHSCIRSESETSSKNHIQQENTANKTKPKRVT